MSANGQSSTDGEEALYAAFLRADLQQQVDELVNRWVDGIRQAPLLWALDQETIDVEVPRLRLRRTSEQPRLAEVVALDPGTRTELYNDRDLIALILRDRGSASPAEVREELQTLGVNKGRNAVQQFLRRMYVSGQARRVGRGRYAPPNEGSSQGRGEP